MCDVEGISDWRLTAETEFMFEHALILPRGVQACFLHGDRTHLPTAPCSKGTCARKTRDPGLVNIAVVVFVLTLHNEWEATAATESDLPLFSRRGGRRRA